MKRVLITGANGFSGRHLVERLRCADRSLFALGRAPASGLPLEYACCDLTDRAAVRRAIERVEPDEVYHLAACGPTEPAERQSAVIVDGFRNLYDALVATAERTQRRVRMLTVGSAAELGEAGLRTLPVREDATCEPTTDYGRAKFAVTRVVAGLPSDGPVEVIVARTFNLVGPGLSERLSLGRFAQQVAALQRGDVDRIRCGNLAHRRDFVDVRDAVRGYEAVLRRGRAGRVYNIATGRSHRLRDVLERLLALSGCRAPIESDDGPLRAGDVADVFGCTETTAAECGWRATTSLERSLRDLLSAQLWNGPVPVSGRQIRSAG